KATQALFSGDLKELDKPMLLEVFSEAPSVKVAKTRLGEIDIAEVLVEAKLATSKGMARKDIQGGGIYVNNVRLDQPDMIVRQENLFFQSILILRKGKKNYTMVLFV